MFRLSALTIFSAVVLAVGGVASLPVSADAAQYKCYCKDPVTEQEKHMSQFSSETMCLDGQTKPGVIIGQTDYVKEYFGSINPADSKYKDCKPVPDQEGKYKCELRLCRWIDVQPTENLCYCRGYSEANQTYLPEQVVREFSGAFAENRCIESKYVRIEISKEKFATEEFQKQVLTPGKETWGPDKFKYVDCYEDKDLGKYVCKERLCRWQENVKKEISYCCCRQPATDGSCLKLTAEFTDNRACGYEKFKSLPQLPNSAYKLQELPKSGDCREFDKRTFCCCTGDKCEKMNITGDTSFNTALKACRGQLSSQDVQVRNLASGAAGQECASGGGTLYTGTIDAATYDLRQRAAILNHLTQFSSNGPLGPALVAWFIRVFQPLAVLGMLALLLYIIAGFMYMLAAGNAERAESAKRMIVWTTFGLVAVLASYMLTTFLFSILVP